MTNAKAVKVSEPAPTPAKPDAAAVAAASEAQGKTVIRPDTTTYAKARASGGGMSQHNGDVIASGLASMDVQQVATVAAGLIHGSTVKDLIAKYEHLNIGQQRMNLGNRIRGAVKRIDKANALLIEKTPEGENKPKTVDGIERFLVLAKPIRVVIAQAEAKAKVVADIKAKEREEAAEKKIAAKAAAKTKAEEAAKQKANLVAKAEEVAAADTAKTSKAVA